jgi:putative FmdB family regulatory protein
MPVYEYHCNHCGRNVSLFYKAYKDYDAAQHLCPECGSAELTRLISRVAIAKPSQNFATMSSGEMLNVLEGGNQQEVGDMMRQLGQDEAVANTLGDIGASEAE